MRNEIIAVVFIVLICLYYISPTFPSIVSKMEGNVSLPTDHNLEQAYSFKKNVVGPTIEQYNLFKGENPMVFSDVLQSMQKCEKFRSFFSSILIDSKFDAYFWETPPIVKKDYYKKEFEFVLVKSTSLERVEPQPETYSQYWSSCKSEKVASFFNLGKDAKLISPCPLGSNDQYQHLAKFIRNAPEYQISNLWIKVGNETEKEIDESPRWLSTSGLGVYWCHIRIDRYPKYYTYSPYKISK